MPKYKLSRRLQKDGIVWPVDSILEFPEGMQPRTAKLVQAETKEVKTAVAEEDAPELASAIDTDDAEVGDTLSSLAKKGK
jgi:hypothetical protein